MVGFITLLTEVLPAGVLPVLASDLKVSVGLAGQSVAVFAMGCIVSAIPLSRATSGWNRRTLLLTILAVSALANLGTALAQDLPSHLATRFVAGLVAGLVWAMLPGYTRGFAEPRQFGAMLSVALTGGTLAMAVGVPVGTLLSEQIGWRAVFVGVAALTVLLAVFVWILAPRVAGTRASGAARLRTALSSSAVLVVVAAVILVVVGQNMAYTYLAPILIAQGDPLPMSMVLAIFGVASMVGTLGGGRLSDRRLGPTLVTGLILGVVGLGLFALTSIAWLLIIAATCWGLAFGSYAALFQVAVARTGGTAADAAQSALVTAWNISIAVGGAVGGGLLGLWGTEVLIPIAAALTLLSIPLGLRIARNISCS
ncbi:MFS transporter [Paeniglutamicibacter sp. NPDC012692]|uniref:MFS transporter n=1 Tax=Paeniglutamicibacter sp. NPDC012692 TaxID=3364388 RepID=UPI00369D1DAF